MYGSGFSNQEREAWRIAIHENLATTFRVLAQMYYGCEEDLEDSVSVTMDSCVSLHAH